MSVLDCLPQMSRQNPGVSVYLNERTKTALREFGRRRYSDEKLGTILRKLAEAVAAEEMARGQPTTRPMTRSRQQVGKGGGSERVAKGG